MNIFSIEKKYWDEMSIVWNDYCEVYDSEKKYVSITLNGLRNHLQMIKYDPPSNLTDKAKEGYNKLIDYFPTIKEPHKNIWIVVVDPTDIYEINYCLINKSVDGEFKTSLVAPSDSYFYASKNIYEIIKSLVEGSFIEEDVQATFVYLRKSKLIEVDGELYKSMSCSLQSLILRNPYYSGTLIMSDKHLEKDFDSFDIEEE